MQLCCRKALSTHAWLFLEHLTPHFNHCYRKVSRTRLNFGLTCSSHLLFHKLYENLSNVLQQRCCTHVFFPYIFRSKFSSHINLCNLVEINEGWSICIDRWHPVLLCNFFSISIRRVEITGPTENADSVLTRRDIFFSRTCIIPGTPVEFFPIL